MEFVVLGLFVCRMCMVLKIVEGFCCFVESANCIYWL